MGQVRELLESNPDLDRNGLNELVFSDAQLKDLYDSRPELKEILLTRAKLFEDEMKELEEQKPESFVAGPCLSTTCRALLDMQRKRLMVKDLGKIKIDVSKTLAF